MTQKEFLEQIHKMEKEAAEKKYGSDHPHYVWVARMGWASVLSLLVATVGCFFGVWTGSTQAAAFGVFYIPFLAFGVCWIFAKMEDS